jgi:hypothetical protein
MLTALVLGTALFLKAAITQDLTVPPVTNVPITTWTTIQSSGPDYPIASSFGDLDINRSGYYEILFQTVYNSSAPSNPDASLWRMRGDKYTEMLAFCAVEHPGQGHYTSLQCSAVTHFAAGESLRVWACNSSNAPLNLMGRAGGGSGGFESATIAFTTLTLLKR